MPSADDPNRPSSAAPLIPVHRVLGSGKVADVLLWRRRSLTVSAVIGASAAWGLFEFAGYRFMSLLANSMLVAVVILFFWAKSAIFLQRPLPPLPDLEVSDEVVEKIADRLSEWINAGLRVAHEIAIGRDRKLFLKVVLLLWAISYVGSFFNFLTLIYLGFIVSISLPALYEKYHNRVDDKLVSAHGLVKRHYGNIFDKYGGSLITKQRKNE